VAIIRTGPFLVPSRTSSGNPITHLFLTFTNLTQRTLTATVRIDQGFLVGTPPSPLTELLPATPISLTPDSFVLLAQTIVPQTTPTFTGPQILIITINGEVSHSGNQIQVSVTGGFSSDGSTLDEPEPTMFFPHDHFSGVHHKHQFRHPLAPFNESLDQLF